MKLYKIWQNVNDDWDTFDSAVVVANSEFEARRMYPNEAEKYYDQPNWWIGEDSYYALMAWAHPDHVKVEYIGEADPKYKEKAVILASFNAG